MRDCGFHWLCTYCGMDPIDRRPLIALLALVTDSP
jgi:hypothetical protein